jgi:hypothetical protein
MWGEPMLAEQVLAVVKHASVHEPGYRVELSIDPVRV